jgi:hypothetical protein
MYIVILSPNMQDYSILISLIIIFKIIYHVD